MKKLFVPIGLLLFFMLCLVPSGQAQTCVAVSQGTTPPWQLGEKCTFTSSSSPVNIGNVSGLNYFQIFFVPSGTVSAAALSLDSSATGLPSSRTTGGIISAAIIGSLTAAGSYTNSSASTPTVYGQLTPSITGSGNVTVVIYGYINAPASSGGAGPASNVSVTNFPTTQQVSASGNFNNGSIGTNGSTAPGSSTLAAGKNSGNAVPLAVDSSGNAGVNIQNATATSAPTNITSTQAVSVTVGGASIVQFSVTGTWTGTLQPKTSVDGTNYTNAVVWTTLPFSASQATVTANGTFCAIVAGANIFEVLGNTVATGTAVVNINATPGVGCPSPSLQGIYQSALPTLSSGNWSGIEVDVNGQVRLSSHMSGTTAGTAPNSTDIIGGMYNGTTTPSPTAGQSLPLQLGPQGQAFVAGEPENNSLNATKFSPQSALTTAVVVKASVGNVFGFAIMNLSGSVCYLEFINAASGPALGTNAAFSIPIPANTPFTVWSGFAGMGNFSSGISVGMATTYNGSTACGSAAAGVIFYE